MEASSIRPAQPGVLPAERDTLIVSAVFDIGAVVITEFQRLMRG